jgi:hypothetical protein
MDIKEKGDKGEEALNRWLDDNGLSYLYIDQSEDTFASLFRTKLKRPDFLVLLESIGMIAVDAKNYTLSGGVYTLNMEQEFQKALTFERLFRIPLWYAYLHVEDTQEVWYWISALKALEVGDVRVNNQKKEQFLAIKLEHFEKIETGHDLGKLYTHRLPSLKNTAKHSISKIAATSNTESPELIFSQFYRLSHSYYGDRLDDIKKRLKPVSFPLIRRVGADSVFDFNAGFKSDVLALVDYMSAKIFHDKDDYSMPLTTIPDNTFLKSHGFVLDHLIYAVDYVLCDDKNGCSYNVYLDKIKLNQSIVASLELMLKDNQINWFEVNMHEDYMIMGVVDFTSEAKSVPDDFVSDL